MEVIKIHYNLATHRELRIFTTLSINLPHLPMHILNFHFLTVYCYGFTDNAEVKRIKMDLCILCKESIRISSKCKKGQRVLLKLVNSAVIKVEACP